MTRNNQDQDPGTASDLAIINAARENYIQARFIFQEHHLEAPQEAQHQLQKAILKYFEVLRPKLKQRNHYWHNADLNDDLEGLKTLDNWETGTHTIKRQEKTLLNGTQTITEENPKLIPIPILRRAGRRLEEAYQKLDLGKKIYTEWETAEITDEDITDPPQP